MTSGIHLQLVAFYSIYSKSLFCLKWLVGLDEAEPKNKGAKAVAVNKKGSKVGTQNADTYKETGGGGGGLES